MQRVHKTVGTKSRKFCSVPQCSSYTTPRVSLHRFPRDRKLCKAWENVLKIGKPITQSMFVCSKHFIAEDFLNNKGYSKGKRKPPKLLKKTAVPRPVPSVNIGNTSSHETGRTWGRTIYRKSPKRAGIDNEESEFHHEELVSQLVPNLVQNVGEVIGNMESIQESINQSDMENDSRPTSNDDDDSSDDMELEIGTAHTMVVESSTQTMEHKLQLPQILNTNDKLKTFTGVDYTILGAYEKCMRNVAASNNLNLSNIEMNIVLVLCKLKTNLSFSCLALLFGLSSSMCTRIFYSTVNLLAQSIKSIIYWPPKEEILKNLPKCFHKFRNTRVILDCTEIKVQKLKCLNCRILSYSHYKRCHTMKFLIGITPSGLISYVSKGYGGRATDKAIFNNENLITKFEPNDGIMVDKGVLIDTECEENLIKLIRPPFLKKKKQLTKEDAELTANIARARVHVERAIEKIKNFKIVNDQIDWYLIPYMDDIITIVAATVNMKNPILADEKF